MPGAELTEVVDEDAWKATLHVKLGPISLEFGTTIRREQVDDAARRVVLSAEARELGGRGAARATIESSLVESDVGTRVDIVTELTLQGAVAQYSRGVVPEVAKQLTKEFAECMARQLKVGEAGPESPPPAIAEVDPVGGMGLLFRALWRSLLRVFGGR